MLKKGLRTLNYDFSLYDIECELGYPITRICVGDEAAQRIRCHIAFVVWTPTWAIEYQEPPRYLGYIDGCPIVCDKTLANNMLEFIALDGSRLTMEYPLHHYNSETPFSFSTIKQRILYYAQRMMERV